MDVLASYWSTNSSPCIRFYRKKKKDKESKHRLEQAASDQNDEDVKAKKAYIDKRTPAQIAFDKMQEKRVSYWSVVTAQ